MASTTFNGPVRSEKGFQVATKNTTTGAITTRMSSCMPINIDSQTVVRTGLTIYIRTKYGVLECKPYRHYNS